MTRFLCPILFLAVSSVLRSIALFAMWTIALANTEAMRGCGMIYSTCKCKSTWDANHSTPKVSVGQGPNWRRATAGMRALTYTTCRIGDLIEHKLACPKNIWFYCTLAGTWVMIMGRLWLLAVDRLQSSILTEVDKERGRVFIYWHVCLIFETCHWLANSSALFVLWLPTICSTFKNSANWHIVVPGMAFDKWQCNGRNWKAISAKSNCCLSVIIIIWDSSPWSICCAL